MRAIYPLLASSLLLSGCGLTWFSHRDTNPVDWDAVEGYAALSTDAQRRTIFIKKHDDVNMGPRFVCAEPPPDVAQAYASALSAALKGGSGNVNVDLSGSRAFATSALPLMYRSQGLQYRRDAMMSLCMAMMNGTITSQDKDTFLTESHRIDAIAASMIHDEMDAIKEAAKVQQSGISAPSPFGQSGSGSNASQSGNASNASRSGSGSNASRSRSGSNASKNLNSP